VYTHAEVEKIKEQALQEGQNEAKVTLSVRSLTKGKTYNISTEELL
jgi:hypothetical protein